MSELNVEKKHSILSPSSSSRWLKCPGSVRLTKDMENPTSSYAEIGTEAHELCEWKLKKHLGLLNDETDIRPTLKNYTEEMEENTEDYKNIVISKYEDAKSKCENTHIFIEEHLPLTDYIDEENAGGTADAMIISDDVLEICDYKNGSGVIVNADHNTQLMIYALGALSLYGDIYDVKEVRLTIIQPNVKNVSTFSISRDELEKWGNEVLKPQAKKALSGSNEFNPSETACRWCLVKATCRYRRDALITDDFGKPIDLLNDDEVLELFDKADEISKYCNEIKEYCLKEALNGKVWKNHKIVEGRSNRKYTDEVAVANVVKEAGFDPYDTVLKNITSMQKLLGKKKFEEMLTPYLMKPQGNPTLVTLDDARPEKSIAEFDFAKNKIKCKEEN